MIDLGPVKMQLFQTTNSELKIHGNIIITGHRLIYMLFSQQEFGVFF